MKSRNLKTRGLLGLAFAVSAMLALGAAQAGAVVVDAAPTWPIPADASVGPPPIPALPAATDPAPPADQIADPVTPNASCGSWNRQGSYGNRWPTTTSWWEYQCSYESDYYYNPCGGPACNAFCPDCYEQIETWTDYFYWDGSNAVFYGEDYYYLFYYTEVDYPPPSTISAWWDEPTAQWYNQGPFSLTVSTQGPSGSGQVSSSPAGIDCGYTCQASFDADTVVTLTATPAAPSIFTGWSGDCSGTGTCQVTMNQARSVTAIFAPPAPTISSFTPTGGPAGTSVDVQGTNFTGATNVSFNGTADPSFVVSSSTDITAHVPTGATTGPVSVTTPGGSGSSSSAFTVIPPPSISSFTPTSGLVGTSVAITGANLTGATSVKFNGTAASFTVNSATSIAATVPSGAATGAISVTTPAGTAASSGSFTVTSPPPKITGFSPTSGHAGQQVTITGSNFTGATSVKLGTTAAKFVVNSPTRITAIVPTITHGPYKWSVANPAGTSTSTGSFRVI